MLSRYLLVSLFILFASAQAGAGEPDYRTWREEVKLKDGRVIVVTQRKRCFAAYTGGNFANCIAREAWLTIDLPEFSKDLIVWHEKLTPMVLNVYEHRLYVVGFPPTGAEFDLYGKQRPPYIGFVWDRDKWQRITFERIPTSIYDANMLIAHIAPAGTELLTLAQKGDEHLNGSRKLPRHFKKIDPDYVTNF
jgi:hypothetical protein